MKDDVIHVEEEFKNLVVQAEDTSRRRYEELSVRGADLKDAVGRLAQEARVRKITLRGADLMISMYLYRCLATRRPCSPRGLWSLG